jgi:hypothetical protein
VQGLDAFWVLGQFPHKNLSVLHFNPFWVSLSHPSLLHVKGTELLPDFGTLCKPTYPLSNGGTQAKKQSCTMDGRMDGYVHIWTEKYFSLQSSRGITNIWLGVRGFVPGSGDQ